MKRSLRKKDLKAARKARQRDVSQHFRKLVIGDRTYLYHVGDTFTEIRGPQEKYLVSHWAMNKMTREQYEAVPLSSVETGCFCMRCDCGGSHRNPDLYPTPGKLREFLIATSVEANKANSRERAAIAAAKLERMPKRKSRGYEISPPLEVN